MVPEGIPTEAAIAGTVTAPQERVLEERT
jgi:hypothetical protein